MATKRDARWMLAFGLGTSIVGLAALFIGVGMASAYPLPDGGRPLGTDPDYVLATIIIQSTGGFFTAVGLLLTAVALVRRIGTQMAREVKQNADLTQDDLRADLP